MTEPLALTTDHVDDSPLLGAQPERVGLQPLLDEYISTHGNWVYLSLDQVSVIRLPQILSEAERRLNHFAPEISNDSTGCAIASGTR